MKKALKWAVIMFGVLVLIGLFLPKDEQPEAPPEVKELEVPAEEMPASNPATEVADVLKAASVLPTANTVRPLALTETDEADGAIAAANIASWRAEGINVKVYGTPEQRNQARLRMVEECPGCNHLAECGPFLLYAQNATYGRQLGVMSKEAKASLREVNETLRQNMRVYREAVAKHYGCQ